MKSMKSKNFRNIYTKIESNQKVFCFRSGLTVYEEVFRAGRYMAAGWNTSGYTLNVLDDMPTRLNDSLFTEAQSFDLEADGVSLAWDLTLVDFSEKEEILENGTVTTHAVTTFTSDLKPLTVYLHTVLDGTAVFSRWLEVENTGDRPINLNVVAPISGGVETITCWKNFMNGAPDPSKIYSLGYMSCSDHSHEGYFKWHPVLPNTQSIDGKYNARGHRHPMFLLRNNLLGKTMILQLGWTGGYTFSFTLDVDGIHNATPVSRLSFRVDMKGQNPITVLAPGDRFSSPKVHVGMLAGDLDEAVNAMHKHLRRSVFTLPAARGVKGWVEGGMGPERLMDVVATKHFADTIAAVGGETLIIDAGWYCPPGTAVKEWWQRVGDWRPDPDLYPNGIEEIRDYIHEKGLLFGLWLDLERLGPTSEMAKAHPEWISKCFIKEKRSSQLNMAIPEAAAWAEAELSRVIEEYKIDLFRLDYNINGPDVQTRYEGENGVENGFARYYANTLAMYERLRRKYPDVVFENCAGGGRRTDVAFVSNFTHTWVSDHNTAPRSFAITNGMTMALPPELADRLVSGMGCHTAASLAWQVRNTIFGRPTTNAYNAVGSAFNPEQIELIRHTFDIYKTHIRPYIDESLIFHHTPELVGDPNAPYANAEEPRGTGILERASEDGRHGVIGIFNLADTPDPVHTVYPKGVDASLTYRVTFDNTNATVTLSGAEMLLHGIRVSLPVALTSELIVYEAKD